MTIINDYLRQLEEKKHKTKIWKELATELGKENYMIAASHTLRELPSSHFGGEYNIDDEVKYIKDAIGILLSVPPEKKSFLGFKYNKKKGPFYVGRVWFDDELRRAEFHNKWVLELYGSNVAPEITDIVEDVAQKHNIEVQKFLCKDYMLRHMYAQ